MNPNYASPLKSYDNMLAELGNRTFVLLYTY